jgi:hypothetical protein
MIKIEFKCSFDNEGRYLDFTYFILEDVFSYVYVDPNTENIERANIFRFLKSSSGSDL